MGQLISPGRGKRRHRPVRRTRWCGAARGRAACTSGRSDGSSPATEKILETSIASSRVRAGMIDGIARASSVLPVPGGPVISTLCPPAAAISRPRLTCSWPRMVEKSLASSNTSLSDLCGFLATMSDGITAPAPEKWRTRPWRESTG